MKTISADASDEAPMRQHHAASATRTVFSTCIGTFYLTTWLGDCPKSLQSRFAIRDSGLPLDDAADRLGILGLDVGVEDLDAEIARVGPSRLEGLVDVDGQVDEV